MKLAVITVASHHFVVVSTYPRFRLATREFSLSLKLAAKTFRNKRGEVVKSGDDKYFASATSTRSEVRYHINHLEDFKKLLRRHRLDEPGLIEWRGAPNYTPTKISLAIRSHFVPTEHQVEAIEYINDRSRPNNKAVIMQAGGGKAQRLSSKIKIPGGWTTMGELKVGDTITAWDGTPTKVTGVFPQGAQHIFRVTFYDGRFTDVTAQHLWRVHHGNTQGETKWRVVDTLEMLRLTQCARPRVSIQLIEPENGPDEILPMEPYTLGVILGDGSTSSGSICVTKSDQEIFDSLEKHFPPELHWVRHDELTQRISGPSGVSGGNAYINQLRDLGLMGKLSYEKFIPEIYLQKASASQRLALLQGLMDTDGTVGLNGGISYATSSKQLSEDVQYLVRSLGWIATITIKQPTYTYLGEKKNSRLSYIVHVRSKKPNSCFRLLRKKERLGVSNQYSDGLKLTVKKIEIVDTDEAQCISIDHPDKLYVTDDFIVTHNTLLAMIAAAKQGELIGIFVEPKYIGQWLKAFQENCVIAPKRICVIGDDGTKSKMSTSDKLKSIINMASEGPLPYDAIIVSSTTFRNYIEAYKKAGSAKVLEETEGYGVPPHLFMQHLGIGLRIIDEAHENFHAVFTLDLYTHVTNSVALSATLFNDEPFLNGQINTAYPVAQRYIVPGFNKYVNAYSLHYSMREPRKIKCQGSMGYSHVEFEKSILKSRNVTEAYFSMVRESMRYTYDLNRLPGDRCLIYFATIDMCTRFTEFIRREYPYLDAQRFCEEDPLENLLTADISVSTVKSAGTGKDIAQLTTVIMTQAINASPSNIQGFGRLRDLNRKEALGRKMHFVYFCGDDFLKHLEYHERKVELLRTRALTYEPRYYGTMI